MKVIIIEQPYAGNLSFAIFEKFPVDLLKETKTLTIVARLETKTRVATSCYIGKHSSRMNVAIDGFKTHEHREMNYFSGSETVSNFFVKSKAQNLDVYKKYIEEMCQLYFSQFGIDELTVNLTTREVF